MKEKDHNNYLARVVDSNDDGKPVVQLFTLNLEGNSFDYEECSDIERMDWDVAKKIYSVIGFIK